MSVLSKFNNLEKLILKNNNLHKLPEVWSTSINLSYLDISNNNFNDITELIDSLKTIPKLSDLNMDIDYNEEEELLFLSLNNLKRINGKTPTISNSTMQLFNDDNDENI